MVAKFLAGEGITNAQFARDVVCSEPHLTLFLQGKRQLSVALAKRFNARTGIPVKALVSQKLLAEAADVMREAAE